jgi:AcrR family transcriptional regulator
MYSYVRIVSAVTHPSTSDRRTQLCAAMLELVATQGVEALSVRQVAAAAGVSIGTVQYHFPTKQAMLTAAFEHAVARTRSRLAALRRTGNVAENLSAALAQLLPLDDHRRADVAVTVAFASLAATTPSLQAVQAELLTAIRAEIAEGLGSGSRPRAALLLAAVDGLALHEVSAPGSLGPRALRRALDLAVADALTPPRPARS